MASLGKLTIGNPHNLADKITPQEVNLGFRTGYILELRHARKESLPSYLEEVKEFVFALNPSQYNLEEPFAVELTPVESNEVKAEENGIIMRNITIEGTTGIKGRVGAGDGGIAGAIRGAGGAGKHVPGLGAVAGGLADTANAFRAIGELGNNGEKPGVNDFRKLRDFFRAYSRGKQDPEISRDLIMVFHVLRDDDHFVVKPKSFTTPRSVADTRIHYKYRIEMTAVAELDETLPPIASELGFADAVGMIAEGLHDARAAFAEMTALTDVLKRKVANINAVALQMAGLINSVGNFINGTKSLIDAPMRQMQAGSDAFDRAADRLAVASELSGSDALETDAATGSHRIRKVSRALSLVMMNADKFGEPPGRSEEVAFSGERSLTNADIDNGTAGASIGSRTRVQLGTGAYAGLDLGSSDSTILVRIRKGDSVQSIAQRHNSVAEAIVLLNDLRLPYITVDGGPGMKQPGDVIAVPVAVGGVVQTAQSDDEYATAEDTAYGVDMRLDPKLLKEGVFDLSVDDVHGSTDVELSRGILNVVQGVSIITHTQVGSTKFLPTIGISIMAGVKGTLQRMISASVSLREAILSDPRIESFNEASVVLDGDKLEQEITPRVRGLATGVKLVVPFGTTAGE